LNDLVWRRRASFIVREEAHLPRRIRRSIDVFWLRLSKNQTIRYDARTHRSGAIFVTSIAVIIGNAPCDPKQRGSGPASGLESFATDHTCGAELRPRRRADGLESIKLLTVTVTVWNMCSGLLCIGDCAHAMSPIGGSHQSCGRSGAAANILAGPLRTVPSLGDLKKSEARELPTYLTQKLQISCRIGHDSRAGAEARPKPPFA